MQDLFIAICNLALTAGWIVLAVLLLRLCLKRAPRWITCLLWGLVALRLVLPFSIESALSLIPSAQTVPSDIVSTDTPSIDSGVTIIDRPVNDLLQTVVPSQPVTPPADIPDAPPVEPTVPLMERITQVAAWVWVSGIALMLVYELVSVWRLRRRVFDAIRLRDNLWQTDRIDSPFILGVFRPRIYLPYGLDEDTTAQVLAHEQSHLRRRDHAEIVGARGRGAEVAQLRGVGEPLLAEGPHEDRARLRQVGEEFLFGSAAAHLRAVAAEFGETTHLRLRGLENVHRVGKVDKSQVAHAWEHATFPVPVGSPKAATALLADSEGGKRERPRGMAQSAGPLAKGRFSND